MRRFGFWAEVEGEGEWKTRSEAKARVVHSQPIFTK